jgi:hypothetical protein
LKIKNVISWAFSLNVAYLSVDTVCACIRLDTCSMLKFFCYLYLNYVLYVVVLTCGCVSCVRVGCGLLRYQVCLCTIKEEFGTCCCLLRILYKVSNIQLKLYISSLTEPQGALPCSEDGCGWTLPTTSRIQYKSSYTIPLRSISLIFSLSCLGGSCHLSPHIWISD